jgi:hypothetical protein
MMDLEALHSVKELKLQFVLYREMQKTSLALRELCLSTDFSEEESMDRLNRLLYARQVLISKLDNLRSFDGGHRQPVPEDFVKLNEARAAVAALQAGIASLDQESREVFLQKLASLKAKIKKVHTGRKFSKAYRPAAESPGIFLDSNIAGF